VLVAIDLAHVQLQVGADDLEVPERYEVHLDRKLERSLTMLIRLKGLRQPVPA
jgi:hypothetical protein